MGYDVSIELPDASLREAYDKAAERLHIHHSIYSWGDGEPSEWETKRLWGGGSFARDLAEYLQHRGKRIEMDEDGYCPSYAIPTEVLVGLGEIHAGMAKALKNQMVVIENLGFVSDEDAYDYWNAMERGIESVTMEYFSIPVPRAISLPEFHGGVVHDDKSAPVPHSDTKAWDAYVAYLAACHAASNANPEDAERLETERAEAEQAYDAVRPRQDTLTIRGNRMEIDTWDQQVSVEKEVRNPQEGATFKACVVALIRMGIKDDYYASDVYRILSEHPGLMVSAFERLGEIGRAAKEAGIAELVVNPSW